MSVSRTALLYDADCGFCRWSVGKILRWDRRGRLRAVPLQSPEAEGMLGGVEPEHRMESWHLLTTDGHLYGGGAAVAPLMRLLPGGRPVAALATAFPGVTDAAYRWVARRRGALGRILGERACELPR